MKRQKLNKTGFLNTNKPSIKPSPLFLEKKPVGSWKNLFHFAGQQQRAHLRNIFSLQDYTFIYIIPTEKDPIEYKIVYRTDPAPVTNLEDGSKNENQSLCGVM